MLYNKFITWLNDLSGCVNNNQPIAICCVGFARSNQLATFCRSTWPSKTLRIYNSGTSRNYKAELADVNAVWDSVDIVIYNSSVDRGVSFDLPHFAKCFCDFSQTRVISSVTAWQLMRRVRQLEHKQFHILLNDRVQLAHMHTLDGVKQDITDLAAIMIKNTCFKYFSGGLVMAEQLDICFGSVFKSYFVCEYKRRVESSIFTLLLLQLLAGEGINLHVKQNVSKPSMVYIDIWDDILNKADHDRVGALRALVANNEYDYDIPSWLFNVDLPMQTRLTRLLDDDYDVVPADILGLDDKEVAELDKSWTMSHLRNYFGLLEAQRTVDSESRLTIEHWKSFADTQLDQWNIVKGDRYYAKNVIMIATLLSMGFTMEPDDSWACPQPVFDNNTWLMKNFGSIDLVFDKCRSTEYTPADWSRKQASDWLGGKLSHYGMAMSNSTRRPRQNGTRVVVHCDYKIRPTKLIDTMTKARAAKRALDRATRNTKLS